MKRNLLALGLFLFSTALLAQSTLNGALQNTDDRFDRPNEGTPPTSYSPFNNVRFDVIPLDITATGLVTISATSSFDNFLILYDPSGFFPAVPLTNALIANDDFIEQNAGFSYNITTTGRYYIVICSFKNSVYGPYSVSVSMGTLLPLKLLSFTASKTSGSQNLLRWTSLEESNLLHYEVQKSGNNIDFINVPNGTVQASNNPSGKSYSFTDQTSGLGNEYYRLKIVERSGTISYSPIAVVKYATTGVRLSVYPNPTVDFLELEMKNLQGKQMVLSIINGSGVVVQSGGYRLNSSGFLKMNVEVLQQGTYFLKLVTNTGETVVPFIKK